MGTQNVAMLRKGEQRFDVMITIASPFPDVQGEVYLCKGYFRMFHDCP
jgi:hypothetical protein